VARNSGGEASKKGVGDQKSNAEGSVEDITISGGGPNSKEKQHLKTPGRPAFGEEWLMIALNYCPLCYLEGQRF